MCRFPILLGLAAVLGLTACETTAPAVETCTDRSGAVYVKPSGGCPAFVAPPVAKRVPAPVKRPPIPAVERDGGDGGGDSGGGWGGG